MQAPQVLKSISKAFGWLVLLLLTLLMLVLAARYFTLNPEVYFPQQQAVYTAHLAGILLHIGGAMVATLLGPTQFWAKLRTGRLLPFHRWLGRLYLAGVLAGGLGGLYMAFLAYGGWLTRLGFISLGLLWLTTAFMAYRAVRRKAIEQHREWMQRNYALTFAAITLRLWQVTFQIFNLDFTLGYMIVAWLCWLPNLALAEWWVRRQRQQPR